MRCKLCNAQLKDAETKCSYCGTLVCKGDVIYHKSAERKKQIVLNILKQSFGASLRFPRGFVIEERYGGWIIFTTRIVEAIAISGFFRRTRRKVKRVEKVRVVNVSMHITNTGWAKWGATVESYFEEYNKRAKQIGEKLSEYTRIKVVLR